MRLDFFDNIFLADADLNIFWGEVESIIIVYYSIVLLCIILLHLSNSICRHQRQSLKLWYIYSFCKIGKILQLTLCTTEPSWSAVSCSLRPGDVGILVRCLIMIPWKHGITAVDITLIHP